MNCSECEQLFDAYLDGHLAGSLRLEFDAHRLHCRRCQQGLAILETVGQLIAADPQTPELPPDFTDRVMQQVRRPRAARLRMPRVAVITAVMLQAAAVLAFVVLWNAQVRSPTARPTPVVAQADYPGDELGREAIYRLIVEGVEDRIWDLHASGAKFGADLLALARYLDIPVPEEIARQSARLAEVNPWTGFWDTLVPAEDDQTDVAVPDEDVHSI